MLKRRLWPYLLLGAVIGWIWPSPAATIWIVQVLALLLVLALAAGLMSILDEAIRRKRTR